MTEDDIQAWIIDLIETSHIEEENRKLALDWVTTRVTVFDAVMELGLMKPDDLASLGLKVKGK
jgi:hypothetical protein